MNDSSHSWYLFGSFNHFLHTLDGNRRNLLPCLICYFYYTGVSEKKNHGIAQYSVRFCCWKDLKAEIILILEIIPQGSSLAFIYGQAFFKTSSMPEILKCGHYSPLGRVSSKRKNREKAEMAGRNALFFYLRNSRTGAAANLSNSTAFTAIVGITMVYNL